MTDKREAILSRLFAIVQAVPDIQFKFRNRVDLKDDARPALVQLDGSETAGAVAPQGRTMMRVPPCLVTMTPQLFYAVLPRTPKNDSVGQDLNTMRLKLMKAICLDSTLLALVGSNGSVVYRGCDTDLQIGGHAIEGQFRLDFALTYAFNPATL